MIYKILHIIFISVTFLFAGCSDEFDSLLPTTKTTPPMTADGKLDFSKIEKVSMKKLLNEFSENQLAAKEKYCGKWIITVGDLSDVSKGDWKDGYVISITNDDIFGDIDCEITTRNKDYILSLKSGDEIVACGLLDIGFMALKLKHCIVKKLEKQ